MSALPLILALSAIGAAPPQTPDFLPVSGVSDPTYVVKGSIIRGEALTQATLLLPMEEMGLMTLQLEMECAATPRYKALAISFYNVDGTPRTSTGSADAGPPMGWFTRNATQIAAVICE